MTTGRRVRTVACALIAALLVVLSIGAVWAHQVMAGDRDAALNAWRNDAITITDTDVSIVMAPTDVVSPTGLVFVPGAKVDPYAYLYKLSGIVEDGVTVVITKPTLNLALADLRPLATFTETVPDVDRWLVGGHSLGGVKACQYAGSDPVIGIVLFGSYCANDLADSGLGVLSFVGENDGLSTPEKIADSATLLPDDAVTVVIPGGNHADFGDYGIQPGDGTSTTSDTDVRAIITTEFGRWLAASAG
ncbi:MAG: alpha/beta hydrolase [Mycetocola sp.]